MSRTIEMILLSSPTSSSRCAPVEFFLFSRTADGRNASETRSPDARPCGPPVLARVDACHADSVVTGEDTGRPNRSYKIGTTTIFKAVELSRPNRMTIAIGA